MASDIKIDGRRVGDYLSFTVTTNGETTYTGLMDKREVIAIKDSLVNTIEELNDYINKENGNGK